MEDFPRLCFSKFMFFITTFLLIWWMRFTYLKDEILKWGLRSLWSCDTKKCHVPLYNVCFSSERGSKLKIWFCKGKQEKIWKNVIGSILSSERKHKKGYVCIICDIKENFLLYPSKTSFIVTIFSFHFLPILGFLGINILIRMNQRKIILNFSFLREIQLILAGGRLSLEKSTQTWEEKIS